MFARAATALAMAAASGLLSHQLGSTLGEAVVNGATFGAAVFICATMVEGHAALAKVSAALAALMAVLSTFAYALTTATDNEGSWTSGWLFTLLLAALLFLSEPMLSRLRLHRRSVA